MEAELEHDHWESYVQCFRQTYGRAPVVYDLFCGEGGYSRGAALAGCTVVGFDIKDQPYTYGKLATSRLNGSNHFAREAIPGMHYCCRDVLSEDFRAELLSTGKIHDFAPPDVIHASPECAACISLIYLVSHIMLISGGGVFQLLSIHSRLSFGNWND